MAIERANRIVTVTGGTGFVGQGLIPELLKRGYTVQALVRSQRSAEKLRPHPDLTFILGDATKQADIERALSGSIALFHLVGIRMREMKKANLTYEDVDVRSAEAAVNACATTGAGRVIFLSAALIGNSMYVSSKRKAEAYLYQSRLDWTIFRPSFIVARGQQWPILMGPLLELIGKLPGGLGKIGRRIGNVKRETLAKAMIWALENDQSIEQIFGVQKIRKHGE